MPLRPYQGECVVDVEAAWTTNRSVRATLPTGTGKGEIEAELAARCDRALWLTHRRELVTDAAARIWRRTGDYPDVEQAESWANKGAPHVVASVFSISQDRRLSRFPRDRFDRVLIDECHHGDNPTYRKVVEYFSSAKVCGFTATPVPGLEAVFEFEAYRYPITSAFDEGWLVPWRMERRYVTSVELADVPIAGSDFEKGALSAALSQRDPVVDLVAGTMKDAGDLLTLVFCVDVEHGKLVTASFGKHGGAARWIDGKTPELERRALYKGFAARDFQFLVACEVPTEGWDEPALQCISFLRPTMSHRLMAQMCGRGLRPLRAASGRESIVDGLETVEARRAAIAGSAKPECLMLDWVGNSGRHSLATPMDVLAGDDSPRVRRRAEKIMLKRPNLTAEAALVKARRDEAVREKKAATRVRVETVGVRVDPLHKRAELAGDGGVRDHVSPGHAKVLSIAGFDTDAMTAAQGRLVFSCLLDCGGTAKEWPRLSSLSDWERGQWVVWAREMRRQMGTPQLEAWAARKKEQLAAFKETAPSLYGALRGAYAGRKKVIGALGLDECGGAQDARTA